MTIAILILFLLLLCNAVFAMSEIAVMSAKRTRLEQAAERGDARAAAALALAGDPTRFLSTVQIGITLIGIMSGAFAEKSLSRQLAALIGSAQPVARYADEIALIIVVLGITYFSLVIGELVPKRLGLTNPERVAKLVARPMTLLARCTSPVVTLLSRSTDGILWVLGVRSHKGEDVSEEDVRGMIAVGARLGVFHEAEREMVDRVFRVSDLRVRALMVPRPDITFLKESDTPERVRVAVATSPVSHFPVCRGDLDHITGVVHVKDLVKHGLISGGKMRVADIKSDALFVPDNMLVLRLLDVFDEHRTHIAIVVNEYGATRGLITLTDVVRAIIGDIRREGDVEQAAIVRRADGSYLVDGSYNVDTLVEELGMVAGEGEKESGVTTVGGMIGAELGHVPAVGDKIVWRGWTFEVIDMDRRRVDKVLVAPAPAEAAGAEG